MRSFTVNDVVRDFIKLELFPKNDSLYFLKSEEDTSEQSTEVVSGDTVEFIGAEDSKEITESKAQACSVVMLEKSSLEFCQSQCYHHSIMPSEIMLRRGTDEPQKPPVKEKNPDNWVACDSDWYKKYE